MADELIEAIRSGKLAAVRAFVKAEPEAARHPRYIGAAGALGSLPILELLHRNGSDLNASYKKYCCLSNLIIAAFVGQPEYVEVLRKAGGRIDGFAAAALGDCKLVEKTLRADPDFALARDHGSLTALHCVAGSRLPDAKVLDVAAMLLDAGAEVAAKTQSWGYPVDAVHLAASAKNLPMFELLLKRGADASKALGPALWNATLDFAALAIEHGGDPDRCVCEKRPLLNHLICWGKIPQTMWLPAHNASPNIADAECGWTAVHQAASRGNARMMQAVLDAGADLGRRDKQGRTPIDIARLAGRNKLVATMAAPS